MGSPSGSSASICPCPPAPDGCQLDGMLTREIGEVYIRCGNCGWCTTDEYNAYAITFLPPTVARRFAEVSLCPRSPKRPRCGSLKWVSISPDEGWTRRAQWAPCSCYHPGVIGPGRWSPRYNDPEAVDPTLRDDQRHSRLPPPGRSRRQRPHPCSTDRARIPDALRLNNRGLSDETMSGFGETWVMQPEATAECDGSDAITTAQATELVNVAEYEIRR
jgi:hypothetical protein